MSRVMRWGLAAAAFALGAVACSDEGTDDGGGPPQAPGAPVPDAGAPDAGVPDGAPDGGGVPDGGAVPDAGTPDGGTSASTAFDKVLGGPGQDEGNSVAIGGDGHLLVASTHFVDLPDFGAGRQPEEGTAALSRFAADGRHLWTYAENDPRECGGGQPCITSGLNARAAAVDGEGRSALATVRYEEGAQFGEYLLRETPRLTVLDREGVVQWTRVIEGPAGNSNVSDLGFDPAGNLLVWGSIRGPGWDFGDGTPRGLPQQEASFLAAYGRDGALRSVRLFGDSRSVSRSGAMAVEADGSVVIAGSFAGRLSFGGEELVGNEDGRLPDRETAVDLRAFVARLGPDGAHRWSRTLDAPAAEAKDLAVGPQGVALAGTFDSSLTFAGRTLTSSFTEAGPTDGFAAVFGLDGTERWATSLRSTFDDHFFGIGFAPNGDVWAAGSLFGRGFVGGTEIPGNSEEDGPRMVLARLRAADGAELSVTSPRRGVIGRGDMATDARGVLAFTGAVPGGERGCDRGCGEALQLYLRQQLP